MSPLKKSARKKSSKCQCTSLDAFWNDDANMAYNDYYKKAPIILERTVELESLEHTFIPDVYKERTWTNCWTRWEMSTQKSFRNSMPMPLWKGIASTVGWKGESSMSQGSPFKRSWRFVQRPHTHPFNMMKEWRNLNKLWTTKSTRRPCTPFHSLRRWEPWTTSWFSIFTRWGTWRTCQHQGPYFYLISLHIRRLTFAVTSITFNPHASQRGIQGWFCHFQALSWLLSQGQGWRFLVDFQWCKGIIQSVLKPWPKASSYPQTIYWCLSNSKRQCCWRRWRHGRRNWAFHISFGGHCTSLCSSACMGTRSSWSSDQKGWTNVWHARLPHMTLNSIHLPKRPDRYTLILDWWHGEGPPAAVGGLRVGIHTILVSLFIPVKKGG